MFFKSYTEVIQIIHPIIATYLCILKQRISEIRLPILTFQSSYTVAKMKSETAATQLVILSGKIDTR